MRESVSRWINRFIARWFTPYGVVGTVIISIGAHLWFTLSGGVTGPFQQYVLGLSELAIIVTAMVGETSRGEGQALQLKLDTIIKSLDRASNDVIGVEQLSDREREEIRHHLSSEDVAEGDESSTHG